MTLIVSVDKHDLYECWENAINHIDQYTSMNVTVETLINNIPIKHIRDALLVFRKIRLKNYSSNDISACMRLATEHCNQLGPKQRVQNSLPVIDVIWVLMRHFILCIHLLNHFLNENRSHAALNPIYFFELWEENI